MWDALVEFDKKLFLFLNDLNSPFMDVVMNGISERFYWTPFYILLLYFLIRYYGKNSIYIVLSVVVLVTLCDQISVHLFKNVVERLRPCHNPDFEGLVHLVDGHCGGKFGFVSSHAANSFGLAWLLGTFLGKKHISWFYGLVLWAIIVSYSRIYLGVHYPGDIFFGALLGIILAVSINILLQRLDKKYNILQLK